MNTIFDFDHEIDVAWCPGCGNFAILQSLKKALDQLKVPREKLVMVSGIGQAAKAPQYVNASFFNGLHGRSLPAAIAIKATNPELTVIVESGDGCTYGEGGNHFMAAIRRNPDITDIVHNNMVYGLTKGQASPTSRRGFVTPVQVAGVQMEPFNPVAVAVALKASFVARAFSGDIDRTADILARAITHKGYALVDIFQPCVSFNRVNTFAWYKEHTYYVDESYDPRDREAAFALSLRDDRFAMGVLYVNDEDPTFEESLTVYRDDTTPLWKRSRDPAAVSALIDRMKL